ELRRTNRNWGKSQLGLGGIAHGAVGRRCGNCLGEVQCTVGAVGEKGKKAGKIVSVLFGL
nr:hypothetical protein [Tanacetum cinerariifolium]